MSEFDPASPERLRQSAEILRTDGMKGEPIAAWHYQSAAAAADRIEELERRWDALPWKEMENHIEWWEEHRDAFRPTRSLEILCKILAAREEA